LAVAAEHRAIFSSFASPAKITQLLVAILSPMKIFYFWRLFHGRQKLFHVVIFTKTAKNPLAAKILSSLFSVVYA
jgi:hypothetical protein